MSFYPYIKEFISILGKEEVLSQIFENTEKSTVGYSYNHCLEGLAENIELFGDYRRSEIIEQLKEKDPLSALKHLEKFPEINKMELFESLIKMKFGELTAYLDWLIMSDEEIDKEKSYLNSMDNNYYRSKSIKDILNKVVFRLNDIEKNSYK